MSIEETVIKKSIHYRERERLKKEYLKEINRLIDLRLGEEGIRIVKDYPKLIQTINYLYLPGQVKYCRNAYACFESIHLEKSEIISDALPGISELPYRKDFEKIESLFENKDEVSRLKELVLLLENNASIILKLIDDVYDAVQNSTKESLKKDFPELYEIVKEYEKSKNN
jgi:hypothetical protein